MPGYAIPHIRVTKRLVHDLPLRTSSLRALGAFANVYAIETLIDEIARDRGVDPIAFRLAHLDDPRARAVIEQVVADSAVARAAEPAEEVAGWGLGYARYKNSAGYCAVMARVVLEDTLRVTDVHAVADLGEVISLDGARNQIEGGIVQATSWTLKEAAPLSGAKMVAEGWLDYPILRFSEVPRLSVHLIDRPELPPLGCGEIAQGPVAAAIGNAVCDATGARLRDLPLTRDRIIAALA